jgi:hypothetical protein
MTEWIVFSNRETKKEYVAITLEGATRDELKETINLIAYENNLDKELITYSLIER